MRMAPLDGAVRIKCIHSVLQVVHKYLNASRVPGTVLGTGIEPCVHGKLFFPPPLTSSQSTCLHLLHHSPNPGPHHLPPVAFSCLRLDSPAPLTCLVLSPYAFPQRSSARVPHLHPVGPCEQQERMPTHQCTSVSGTHLITKVQKEQQVYTFWASALGSSRTPW